MNQNHPFEFGRVRSKRFIHQSRRYWLYYRKPILACVVLLTVVVSTAIISAHWLVERAADDSVFYSEYSMPKFSVGVVLGCSPYLSDGRENHFFRNRIQAAADLIKQGRVGHLIVSGDNSRHDYDEPTAMRDALINLSVPIQQISLDYAGFSTLDSVVRANRVFGQETFIVISQEFHVKRAVFIGEAHGLNVSGYVAQDVSRMVALKTHAREYLARVKTVLDVTVLKRKPRFLGDPVFIG